MSASSRVSRTGLYRIVTHSSPRTVRTAAESADTGPSPDLPLSDARSKAPKPANVDSSPIETPPKRSKQSVAKSLPTPSHKPSPKYGPHARVPKRVGPPSRAEVKELESAFRFFTDNSFLQKYVIFAVTKSVQSFSFCMRMKARKCPKPCQP